MRRRILLIEPAIQRALMTRIAVYWLLFITAVALLQACSLIMAGVPQTGRDLFYQIWATSGPALAASVMVLPIVVVDCLRLSNRFAGPIFRMRRAMQKVIGGEEAPPQHFRQRDFLHDFSDDFNRLLMMAQQNQLAEQPDKSSQLLQTNDSESKKEAVASCFN